MIRVSVISLVVVLAMLLAGAVAQALPEPPHNVVITLDEPPRNVEVGVPFRVAFTVQAPTEGTPAELAPRVIAHNAGTADQVTVAARPERAPGHFVALLILPSAGRWEWQIRPFGEAGEPVAMAPLEVDDPQPQPAGSALAVFWAVLALISLGPLSVLVWALYSGRAAEALVPEPVSTR